MNVNLRDIDAVLFDLDGTLLDSAPDLGFAANQLRIARGLPPLPQDCYRPFVGTGARGMLRIALSITPENVEFEALKEEFFAAYERCMGAHSMLFEGVESVLHSLSGNGRVWGVVTNKSERFALPIAKTIHAISDAVVICGDTTAHSKPHPEPLLEAARRLNVLPQRCIYVGDDERDMIAARAAGMRAVAAAYGYLGGGIETVPSWQPDAVINSPGELTELLGLV